MVSAPAASDGTAPLAISRRLRADVRIDAVIKVSVTRTVRVNASLVGLGWTAVRSRVKHWPCVQKAAWPSVGDPAARGNAYVVYATAKWGGVDKRATSKCVKTRARWPRTEVPTASVWTVSASANPDLRETLVRPCARTRAANTVRARPRQGQGTRRTTSTATANQDSLVTIARCLRSRVQEWS